MDATIPFIYRQKIRMYKSDRQKIKNPGDSRGRSLGDIAYMVGRMIGVLFSFALIGGMIAAVYHAGVSQLWLAMPSGIVSASAIYVIGRVVKKYFMR
ncbi:hypothetical protein HY622_01600 [Candidatus Uhrbacteria bacterium]|nr:hypothetical protein [Candidatus Uhrbacteria bacterium]